MSQPPATDAFHSPIIDSDDMESNTPPDADTTTEARRSIAAPVPIRRSVQAPPVLDSRSLSPIADASAPVSQSVPAQQLHRGPLSLSSHNLLDSLGREEGGDELFTQFFEAQPTHAQQQHGHGAMHPSHSSGQLQQQQQQQMHQYSRAQAIPIHATSHSLAHHSGSSHLHQQQFARGGSGGGAPGGPASQLRGFGSGHSPSSISPPTSVAGSAGAGGTSYVAHFAGAGAALHDPVAPPRHPPSSSQRLPPTTSPAAPPGRSWSLIEHAKRYLTDPSSSSSNGGSDTPPLQPAAVAAASAAAEEPRRRSLISPSGGRGSLSSAAGASPIGASDVVASSWSGGGVTHISLPVNLASANAEARTRGRSHSSVASSALTAHVQAVAAAAPPVTPARAIQSSALIPSSTKSSLAKLEDYVRELGRTVEEYKQLLVRLGSRKRQVLGTLQQSMTRLSSWMQVSKLEVLQELMTLQDEVFGKEEAMLQRACVILKERAATLSGEQEEILEQLLHLTNMLQAEMDAATGGGGGKKVKLSKQQQAVQASFAAFPPKALMDSIAVSPKLFAQSHALLRPHSDEHRALTARLEACKARYLAVARATDLEELVDRKTRVQKVVAALESRCAEQGRRNAAAANPAAAATAAAAPSAAAPADVPAVCPSQQDYSPAREIELEYAKLLLDERTKEGRAVAKFVAELEAAVSAKDASTTPSSSAGVTPPNELSANVTAAAPHSARREAAAVPHDAAAVAAAANPAASLAAVSSACFDSLSSFLSRLESSIVRDYAVPAPQRPHVRLLNQRTIFPRIWHLLLALGYEEEDLRCLPPLPAPSAKATDTSVATAAATDSSSQLTLPSASACDMSSRELQLQSQLDWLRQVTPAELGIPPTFLKPTAKPFPSVASPKAFVSSAAAAPVKGSPSPAATPTRAPPSYKPTLPPVSSFASRSYTAVIDLLEDVGQLSAPSDMVGCLMAASKAIYRVARGYVEQHAALAALAASAHGGPTGKAPKSEALGADSFFPIFLYVLVQSSVRHWLHRLKVMQRFALDESSSMAEPAYYLTTLEAALIFVAQATPDNINPNSTQAIAEEEEGRRRRKSSAAAATAAAEAAAAAAAKPVVPASTVDAAAVDPATIKLAAAQLTAKDDALPLPASRADEQHESPSNPAPLSTSSVVAIPASAAQPASSSSVVSFSAPAAAPAASAAASLTGRDDAADTTASSPALSSSSPASVSHAAAALSPSPTPLDTAAAAAAATTGAEPRAIPAPLLIPASPSHANPSSSSTSAAQRLPDPTPPTEAHPHDSIASSHPLFSASNKYAPQSPFTARTFDANDL